MKKQYFCPAVVTTTLAMQTIMVGSETPEPGLSVGGDLGGGGGGIVSDAPRRGGFAMRSL